MEVRAEDAALVREVAGGSEVALAALYDRHVDGVYAAALRVSDDRSVAEEVVQETFLALWNRAELFDPAVGSLAAWLRTIARNRTVDRLRATGRRPTLVPFASATGEDPSGAALDRLATPGAVIGGAVPGPGPDEALEAGETRAAILGALDTMPEPERRVILLAYREGLSQSEIAIRTGWPLGTVKTRTRRALGRLRGVLEPEWGLDGGPGSGDPTLVASESER